MLDLYAELEKAAEEYNGKRFLPKGFHSLDQLIESIDDSHLYIIGGSKPYKNRMLFLSIINNLFITNAKTSMIISFEGESNVLDWGRKLLALKASVSLLKLARGNLSAKDWRKLAKASGDICEFEVSIIQEQKPASKTIEQCHAIFSERGKFDYIAIDNLQGNKEEWICNNRDMWKQLAVDLEVPVIVVSKSNKGLPVPEWEAY